MWLSLLLLFFHATARASESAFGIVDDFDLNAGVSAETYPLGGLITGTAGYGHVLWQDGDASAPGFWKFGYVRPAVEWQTAALTNRVTGVVEVFPISIVGLSAGGGADFRNYNNFTGIDCGKFMCDDTLTFKFAQAQLIAGVGPVSLVVSGRYDTYWATSGDRPFYDYMSYLTGRNGSDELRTLTFLALYTYNERWKIGLLGWAQDMVFSGSNNDAVYAMASYRADPWQISFGVGDYRSDHQALKPSGFVVLTYTFRKGVGLLR